MMSNHPSGLNETPPEEHLTQDDTSDDAFNANTPVSAPDNPEERGRLKRRRLSSHSPPRAPSPSRGHDRDSGSRHRHHYRKHHRPSSSSSFTPPPTAKKNRRRSDAEPDHTLRGRVRNRSPSKSESPLVEGDEEDRPHRKRSPPPSRHRSHLGIDGKNALRRQRSFPNLYKDKKFYKHAGNSVIVSEESGMTDGKNGIEANAKPIVGEEARG